MPSKPTGNPMGRPKKEIDVDQFRKLCALQCTEVEIAAFFECDQDTVCNWCKRTFGMTFLDTYKVFSSQGKIALRRYQFKQAEKNPAMAIFLGKNWLEQTDKVEQTITEVEDLSSLAELLRDNSDGNDQNDEN